MLFVLPIEPLKERYSAQWLEWTRKALHGKIGYRIIHSSCWGYEHIQEGAFLDCVKTNQYKAHQLQYCLHLIRNKRIKDEDILWIHDAWFPGLEMLAYVRDGLGLKFKMYGMLHAGTYDPYDFLSQKGMGTWGHMFEKTILSILDGVFVATKYHKELITKAHPEYTNKIHVTGFPIYDDWCHLGKSRYNQRNKLVVFPHRMDSEKRPDLFRKLMLVCTQLKPYSDVFRDYKFLYTKEHCKTKECYYRLLCRAEFAVSFANQETWGIAMQEATFAGCIPIVPNELSYKEMYIRRFRYNTYTGDTDRMIVESAATAMWNAVHEPDINLLKEQQRNAFRQSGKEAFSNMFEIMQL